jgi:hypothetical protein
MNVNTLRFKPKMAWNTPTLEIYQKIERGINRLQSQCNDTLPDLTNPTPPNRKNFLLDELDRMLQDVSKIHADIKRLQILKVWLSNENTIIIGNLLQNNAYLGYNEQQLEKIVKKISS